MQRVELHAQIPAGRAIVCADGAAGPSMTCAVGSAASTGCALRHPKSVATDVSATAKGFRYSAVITLFLRARFPSSSCPSPTRLLAKRLEQTGQLPLADSAMDVANCCPGEVPVRVGDDVVVVPERLPG